MRSVIELFPFTVGGLQAASVELWASHPGGEERRHPSESPVCCLGPEGEIPFPHGRQRRTSLFGRPAFAPALPKKPAPSLL
jgi:hypothetical protein